MSLGLALGPLQRGGGDPAHRRDPAGGWWRTTRTPQGTATLRLSMQAGEVFHLTVLRRGRVLKLELSLDRRPKTINNDFAGEAFDRDRRAKADAYWRQSFAPLLPETLD